jgi:hypothetical protein
VIHFRVPLMLMGLLRKLTLSLLMLPLTLNGLWVLCRDVPSQPQTTDSAQSPASSADEQKEECERLCARQSSLCLTSAGDKTSVTIIVFGVAIFPTEVQIGSPSVTRQTSAASHDFHSDPNIPHPSPPPRV